MERSAATLISFIVLALVTIGTRQNPSHQYSDLLVIPCTKSSGIPTERDLAEEQIHPDRWTLEKLVCHEFNDISKASEIRVFSFEPLTTETTRLSKLCDVFLCFTPSTNLNHRNQQLLVRIAGKKSINDVSMALNTYAQGKSEVLKEFYVDCVWRWTPTQ